MLKESRFLTAALLSIFVLAACGGDDPSDPGDGDGDGTTTVTFVYDPPAGAPSITSVDVRGTFNDWGNTQAPLAMEEQNDGTWEASVDLAPGVYEYKYVFNGSIWPGTMCDNDEFGDPSTGRVGNLVTTCVDDEHGGMNAELIVD